MTPRRTGGYVVAAIVLLLLIAAPVFGLGPNDVGLVDHRTHDRDRDQIKTVAEDQVIDLTTVDATTVNERIAAMSERSTGEFKTQLEAMTSTFAGLVEDEAVTSTGQVNASAVSALDGDAAEVIVVVTALVKNASSQQQDTDRSYRINVELTKNNGDWLVSNMGFVQ